MDNLHSLYILVVHMQLMDCLGNHPNNSSVRDGCNLIDTKHFDHIVSARTHRYNFDLYKRVLLDNHYQRDNQLE